MFRALTVLRLALLSFVGAIGLLSACGVAGAWVIAEHATPLGVVLWMLPSILVGALFVVHGTAHLQTATAAVGLIEQENPLARQGRLLIAVFVLFSVTISVAGYFYIDDLTRNVRQQRLEQQQAIASLKAQQLQKWLFERSSDTRNLGNSILRLKRDPSTLDDFQISLVEVWFGEILAASPGRVSAILAGSDGRVIAKAGDTGEARARLVGLAARPGDGQAVAVRDARTEDGKLRIDFVQRLAAPGANAPDDAAILAISVDPGVILLPELQRWPTESASSEVVLIKKAGDNVEFLVQPYWRPRGEAGPLTIPISRRDVAAVQAMLAGDGVREAHDYRGVDVLTASHRIDGTPWVLIAKTDAAEALAPIDHRARLVTWLTAAAILVAAVTTIGLWHVGRVGLTAYRNRKGAPPLLSDSALTVC